MNDALVPVLIVAGVIVLGLIMRRATRPETREEDGAASDSADRADDSDEAPPHPDSHAPVTTDGVALLRMGSQIRLMPTEDHADAPHLLGGEAEAPREREESGPRAARGSTGLVLQAGDFTAARVRRESGEGWRVETHGRDGEFGMLTFETESIAREAMTLLEEVGIVRRPLDDDGAPVPASSEDFEEARRRFEETERALAIEGDDDDPPRPNDWSSRR